MHCLSGRHFCGWGLPISLGRAAPFTISAAAVAEKAVQAWPSKKRLVEPCMEMQYYRSKAHNALGVEQRYSCGYCGRIKISASLCADGQVRIRCLCGGKREDGNPRMHANWKAPPETDPMDSEKKQVKKDNLSKQDAQVPVSMPVLQTAADIHRAHGRT